MTTARLAGDSREGRHTLQAGRDLSRGSGFLIAFGALSVRVQMALHVYKVGA
jgi:hypothetical protein